ncbi:MAG TPA: helix-turn-helix domain-containing protein [Aldersonia sp.]
MSAVVDRTVLPTSLAEDEAARLLAVLDGDAAIAVTNGAVSAELPVSVRKLLRDAVAAFANGQAVTVSPVHTVLTTQEAAELLGITRPTFVRLLERGEIPYTRPGRHRRVELADVLAYRERLREIRRSALTELAAEDSADPVGFTTTR